MSEVIKVNFRAKWGSPVMLREGIWVRDKVWGPADALVMLSAWPYEKGLLHEAAVGKCRDAVMRGASLAHARGLFVACCMEKHMLGSILEYERLGV